MCPCLHRGMTMVELMIGLTILAMLLLAGMPNFSAWLQSSQIRVSAESIQNGMMMARAEATLSALTPDEVNEWEGKDLDLQIGPRKLAFTSETLILSFSLPNFHFHTVTAYDILRSNGVPLGKRDYERQLRTRST